MKSNRLGAIALLISIIATFYYIQQMLAGPLAINTIVRSVLGILLTLIIFSMWIEQVKKPRELW